MITANFYHINSTNGLFYYGIDYLSENKDCIRKILVNSKISNKIKLFFPDVEVIECSIISYIFEILKATSRSDLIYTPTSHPFPFVKKQIIVFHDAYPFLFGRIANLKRILFVLSWKSSRCKVAYINKSSSRESLIKFGVDENEIFFAPNKFPNKVDKYERVSTSEMKVIGLFGTDSFKKRYESIFEVVNNFNLNENLQFILYGHKSDYFLKLKKEFINISIDLVESDSCELNEFVNMCDAILSVSEYEGFGRPIASAVMAGAPVFLIENPVFREFFSKGAIFFNSVEELILGLNKNISPDEKYEVSCDLTNNYFCAAKEIKNFSKIN